MLAGVCFLLPARNKMPIIIHHTLLHLQLPTHCRVPCPIRWSFSNRSSYRPFFSSPELRVILFHYSNTSWATLSLGSWCPSIKFLDFHFPVSFVFARHCAQEPCRVTSIYRVNAFQCVLPVTTLAQHSCERGVSIPKADSTNFRIIHREGEFGREGRYNTHELHAPSPFSPSCKPSHITLTRESSCLPNTTNMINAW